MIFEQPQLGFSLTKPFKSVAHAVSHEAKAVGKGAVHVAKKATSPIARLALFPVVELNKVVLTPIVKTALKPVKSRVNTLKTRRAQKLAWDRRKSTTPTPAEHAEATSWAKSKLRGEAPPLGLMLSLLAGPPIIDERTPVIGQLGEPATASVLASIPALIALMNTILSRSSKSGEAPASVGGGGKHGGGANASGDAGGGAQDDGGADAGSDTGSDTGSGAKIKLPGVGPVKKSYVLIGGAVLGGALLLALLTRKST